MQGTVSRTALGGVVNRGQLMTENENFAVYLRHQAHGNFYPYQGQAIVVLKTYFDI